MSRRPLSLAYLAWLLAALVAACSGASTAEPGIVILAPEPSAATTSALPSPQGSTTPTVQGPTAPAPTSAPQAAAPWSQQAGSARRNWTATVGGPDRAPALLWQAPLPGAVTAGLVVGADGTVYVAVRDGLLLAVGPDGVPRWQFVAPDEITLSPALSPAGPLYVGVKQGVKGTLFALDPATGEVLWEQELSSGLAAALLLTPGGDLLYIDYLNAVHALDASGAERWTWKEENFRPADLVMDGDGILYVAGPQLSVADTPVYALNASDGALLWDLDVGVPGVDGQGRPYFMGSALVRVDSAAGQPQVSAVPDQEAQELALFRTVPLTTTGSTEAGVWSFLVAPSWDAAGLAYGFVYSMTVTPDGVEAGQAAPAASDLRLAGYDWAGRQPRWQVGTGIEAAGLEPWSPETWFFTGIAIGPERRLYFAAREQLYAYGLNE